MSVEITIFDDCFFADVHQGGMDGYEEYDDDVYFVRLQCHGNWDASVWINKPGLLLLQKAINDALGV